MTKRIADQAGTVHQFDFGNLRRQTHDRVTTLGSGVDGAVRRISSTNECEAHRSRSHRIENID